MRALDSSKASAASTLVELENCEVRLPNRSSIRARFATADAFDMNSRKLIQMPMSDAPVGQGRRVWCSSVKPSVRISMKLFTNANKGANGNLCGNQIFNPTSM